MPPELVRLPESALGIVSVKSPLNASSSNGGVAFHCPLSPRQTVQGACHTAFMVAINRLIKRCRRCWESGLSSMEEHRSHGDANASVGAIRAARIAG